MKAHYTAAELAELRLPGLPQTESGIIRRAKNEYWPSQRRKGRGGGSVFPVAALPRAAREALLAREAAADDTAVAPAEPADPPAGLPDMPSLTDDQRRTAEARAAIVAEVNRLGATFGRSKAIDAVVGYAREGRLRADLMDLIPLANARGNAKRTLSRRTVYNWVTAHERDGVPALAPKPAQSPDTEIPAWAAALLREYRKPQKPSLQQAVAALRADPPEGITPPTYEQARRFLSKLDPITKAKGRVGPNALRAYKAYTRRDTSELWPGAVVSADGHSFKAKVLNPLTGKPFTPEITIVIDIFSRYVTGWSVGLAENSIDVLEALSSAMVARDDGRKTAVPAIFYADNGAGFKADLLGTDCTGFFARWGITAQHSVPYNAQARGAIEIFNKNLIAAAKTLPTYQGQDMDKDAARQVKRITDQDLKAGRKPGPVPTWDEFRRLVQATVDAYNDRPHRNLPKITDPETGRRRHLSPREQWERAEAEGAEIPTVPVSEAPDLWRPYERRTCRRGEVRIHGHTYFSRELEPYHGEDVMVGYDVADGRQVYVKDMEGRHLAIAGLDANSVPYVPAEKLAEATSKRRQTLEKRLQGRLQRNDAKRREIEAEAPDDAPTITAEAAPAPPEDPGAAERYLGTGDTDTGDTDTGDTDTADAGDGRAIASAGAPANTRPIFADAFELAKWAADNPDRVTDQDRAELARNLQSRTFRTRLDMAGVDPAAVADVANCA